MRVQNYLIKAVAALFIASLALPIAAMDLARAETRTDLAVSAFGVTGQGVLVAVIDRGIDWRNNDFRNDDGTTRIKYIYDLTDSTGATAPGNTYGAGTIYTEAQINAALTGGTALNTRDAVGHGTTTSGIIAGDGSNLPSRKFRGMAPNASIIAVKFTTEGAPAHDGQLAEAAFYNTAFFPKALDFVRDKASQLGMPVVMLGNFGSILGPTDGTDEFSRKIDATVGPGKRGIVYVSGPGDDGGMPNHAGGNVGQGETISIQVQKNVAGNMNFDLWYPNTDRFNVAVETPVGNFGPYVSPVNNNNSDTRTTAAFSYNHQGSGLTFFGTQNTKREILLQIGGPVGLYTVKLTGATVAAGGRFDAVINPSNIHTNNRFLNFIVPGSIWYGAAAFNNICPGDYVIRTNWIDIDGIPRSNTDQGAIGDIWTGSSVGPTFDGRLGVDLVAPGDSVFTTLNPTSNFARFRFNHIQDGNGFYTRASAVSAAAPQVTGLIALMLQKNPNLDAAQIKSILQRTARKDGFTGPNPSGTWGHGKMDSYAALEAVAATSAGVSVTGRVTTPAGQGLRNAVVSMIDSQGIRRTATTSSFGVYTFTGIDADKSYTLTVASKRYRFSPRTTFLTGNSANVDFSGLE